MKRVTRTVSIVLVLCLVSIWALPIKKAHAKAKKNVSTQPKEQSQLHEQEKELENLAKLQKEKADNVVFQTTKDIKVVQEDGKKQRVVKIAKNVVNADNGDVLSSVRKTVKAENKANGIPKVSAITKVDIPLEGIHNTFTEDDDEDSSEEEAMAHKKNMPSIVSSEEESDESSLDEDIKDLQKSSKVMATYLLETGNFERFEDALRDIVKVGLMTVSEANEYEKIVLKEYEEMMALEKAEELQAKAAEAAQAVQAARLAQAAQAAQLPQVPLDYPERDYNMPFQLNNDMDADEDDDDMMNVKRYIARRRSMLPLPTRNYAGPDFADYPDPLQSYNGYEDMQSDEARRDGNEWLEGLLEQEQEANDYPEARQYYNEQSRENPPMDQERMQAIAHKIFDSEPLSRGYSAHPSYEDVDNDEEDEMMEPAPVENDHNQSEESVSALRALAKMDTPVAKQPKVKTETKHLAKKQDAAATDKKKKST